MYPQIRSKLDAHRRNKPLAELRRKAQKAKRRKQKIWTQEELDLAIKWGEKTAKELGW